ncbi:MAG: inositol monophosphatase [Ktedonobacteraceae bacterium]|nr:inositol monophosphatase [Ktedonobacteraceae bacterium]
MLELLEQLFRQVRVYVQSERYDRHQVYQRSPKHTTMLFDREAEDLLIEGLEKSGLGFEVITEERETLRTVANPPYRIIVDPVDGSNNVSRGIMTAAVALAVLPIDAPVVPEEVQWALVGELYSGTVYAAHQKGGAFRNGRRCQVSNAKSLQTSLIGLNLDQRCQSTIRTLFNNMPPYQVRRTGSSAIDSVYVASGTYDAYVDVGDVLTGESFLASASIVLEAGGIVTDHRGQALRPVTNLTDGYSVVMAASRELHQEILASIRQP